VLVTHDDSMNPWIDKVKGICGNSVSLVNNSEWLDTLYRFQGLPSCVIYPPVFWKEYRVNSTRQYVTLVNCNKNKGVETFYEIARRMSHVEFLAVAGAYGDQIPPPADLQNVRGLRHQADIRSVFAQTGILCVPSEKESWGKTALEAAASGIPVLAHPTAGLKEALGPDGIYCNRENVEAWVREIQKLLDSPLAYEKASRAIYRRVVSLDPTQQLEEFRAFLLDRRWVG
jgi:glycosyltransferase involved in cell wall biosynthesis